jgi:hypothetical protein
MIAKYQSKMDLSVIKSPNPKTFSNSKSVDTNFSPTFNLQKTKNETGNFRITSDRRPSSGRTIGLDRKNFLEHPFASFSDSNFGSELADPKKFRKLPKPALKFVGIWPKNSS